MTNRYVWIAWNHHKRVYDAVVIVCVMVFLALFMAITFATSADSPDPAAAAIRAFGACGLTLLHVTLCIGPLARLSRRFAPLLYNRRHLGVTVFFLGLAHGLLATVYYGAFGESANPLSQILFAGRGFDSIATFPYELLGFVALIWLFLMAATSHDFWLKNLSPTVWKTLHMGVYLAYATLIAHVALGSMRDSGGWLVPAVLLAGAGIVGGLHLAAGLREVLADEAIGVQRAPGTQNWIRVCNSDEIRESRAKVVCLPGKERVAIFRHQGKLSAVSNVCAHQGGPLGEGRIVDGCITCPWHGYQYRPEDGRSPPPYNEKIPTYRLRVEGQDVYLNSVPLSPGAAVDPVAVTAHPTDETLFEDVAKTRSLPSSRSEYEAVTDDVDTSDGSGDEPEVDPDAPTTAFSPFREPPS